MVATRRATGALKRKELREASDNSDVDDVQVQKKRKRTNKSKEDDDFHAPNNAGSATSTAKTKKNTTAKQAKFRGNRAKLAKLPEMPLDIIYSVTSYLTPRDLLQLSRTDKLWRTLLTSRNSVSFWRAARANLEDLPPCPDDLTEFAYARLLFDRYCHVCGKDRCQGVQYAARLRLCESCILTHSMNCRDARKYCQEHGVDKNVVDLIPLIHVSRRSGRVYNASLDDLINQIQKISALPAKAGGATEGVLAFMNERKQALEALIQHACDIVDWMENAKSRKARMKDDATGRRYQAIYAKLKEEGYSPEELAQLHCLPEVTLPTDLTPLIWKKIRAKVIAPLDEQRAERAANLRRAEISRRSVRFKPLVSSYRASFPEPERFSVPSADNMMQFQCVIDLLEDDDAVLDEQALDRILPDLHKAIEQWRTDLHAHMLQLAAKLPSLEVLLGKGAATPDADETPSEAELMARLERCDAWFLCPRCSDYGLRYHQVLGHSHTEGGLLDLKLHMGCVRAGQALVKVAARAGVELDRWTVEEVDALGSRFVSPYFAYTEGEPRRFSHGHSLLRGACERDARQDFSIKYLTNPPAPGVLVDVIKYRGLDEPAFKCGLGFTYLYRGRGCGQMSSADCSFECKKFEEVIAHVAEKHNVTPQDEDVMLDTDFARIANIEVLRTSRPAATQVRCLVCQDVEWTGSWNLFIDHIGSEHRYALPTARVVEGTDFLEA